MKRIVLGLIGILLAFSADLTLAQVQEDSCRIGVAFLGYYTDYESFVGSPQYASLCKRYPALDQINELAVDAVGEEFYLVVPYKNVEVTVNESSYERFMNGLHTFDGQIYYKTENGQDSSLGGQPFLMRCNFSDVFPNTVLVIDGKGELVEYYPRLDPNQGGLASGPYVCDLTRPLPQTEPEGEGSAHPLGLKAFVKNGRPVILFDEKKITASGYIAPDEFRAGDVRSVEDLNGICQKVFIGDIGQDLNPWLCMLMEGGYVQALSLMDAMRTGDFSASAPLPGFSDIQSFVNAGGGEYEPGSFSYTTIYGVDSQGKRHEVEPFMWSNSYICQLPESDAKHVYLHLSSNWRIRLSLTSDYDVFEHWTGNFVEKKTLSDTETEYSFHMKNEYSENGILSPVSGTFRIRTDGSSFHLIPQSGFTFYGKFQQLIPLEIRKD